MFRVETVVDSPRDITGVRLAIGSNAASRWWLNGEPVIALNDDRLINGGGATDFCARFPDQNDKPVRALRISP